MQKQDSWNSDFRKKRFYENKEIKQLKKYEENFYTKPPKSISVMLDLDGTCDFINDEKAQKFIEQLDFIIKKFRAQVGTICISTHDYKFTKIKTVLDILNRHLLPNIEIGPSFYYGGEYDYQRNVGVTKARDFNSNKLKTFVNYYLKSGHFDNQWFAIIDDFVSDNVYKQFKDNHPMLLCLPSQSEKSVERNNFMRIASKSLGFDGVIEGLDIYTNSILKLTPKQILEKQKNMITHLPSHELIDKVNQKDFNFIDKYFKEGYADFDDYKEVLGWLTTITLKQNLSKKELIQVKKIVEMLTDKLNQTPSLKPPTKIKKCGIIHS